MKSLIFGLLILSGCWNTTFDKDVWLQGNDDQKCAMAADLESVILGMDRSGVESLLGVQTDNAATYTEYIGACRLGCQGGGVMLLRVNFEENVVISSERFRS